MYLLTRAHGRTERRVVQPIWGVMHTQNGLEELYFSRVSIVFFHIDMCVWGRSPIQVGKTGKFIDLHSRETPDSQIHKFTNPECRVSSG
jgi:hypothetical protein